MSKTEAKAQGTEEIYSLEGLPVGGLFVQRVVPVLDR